MAALTIDRKTPELATSDHESLPVAASTKIYGGALVAINQSGHAVPASADSTLRVAGVADALADNASGAAAAIRVLVKRGPHGFKNSAGVDAITAADAGRPCYVVDDQTVARTSNAGARPIAGLVHSVDGSDIYVDVGEFPEGTRDLLITAGEDLSSDQFKMVKVGAAGTVVKSGAGEAPLGVVQNAPANAAIAVVRIFGVTRVKADGTGVTRGKHVSSAAGGVARESNNAATGLAHTNTSDAGAATDPLIGAYIIGIALETAAASAVFGMAITHAGAVPVTAL